MLPEPLPKKHRQRELNEVEGNIRHNAQRERSLEGNHLVVKSVHVHEPQRSEDVARRQSDQQSRDIAHYPSRSLRGDKLREPVYQRGQHKSENVSARQPEQRSDAALELREYGQSERSEQQEREHRERAALAAEQHEREEDREGLERERDVPRCGDINPRAHDEQHRHQRGECELLGRESSLFRRFTRYSFFHLYHSFVVMLTV